MSEPNKERNSEELYEAIVDSLVENEIREYSNPKEYLESQGIDSESLVASGLILVQQWKNKVRLERRRKEYERLQTILIPIQQQIAETPAEGLKKRLIDIICGDDLRLAEVYWHKLESVSDADLQNIVKEQQLLEYFAKIYEDND